MLRIEKILFPTDFTECAEHAFSHAAHLAARFGAELHVLHVVVPSAKDPDNPMTYLDDVDLSVTPSGRKDSYRHEGVRVLHAQEMNFSEATGILEYADRHGVDLIVMGTHGRRGLGRLLLGSVSEEVVRGASGPVLTVCPGAEAGGNQPVHRILVPVDFSDSSVPALTHAKELAAAYEAHLDVLHVITEVALPGVYGIEPVSVAGADVQRRVHDALRIHATKSPGANVPFDVHVLVGFPARDIVDFAADHEIDMIVLSTHGRTGLKRLVMGSVAENVVRMAPCPVFTVKSFGKSLLRQPADGTAAEAVSEMP